MDTLGYIFPITNYNVPKDCCCEECCDNMATKSAIINIDGLSVSVMFCEEHANKYEAAYFSRLGVAVKG